MLTFEKVPQTICAARNPVFWRVNSDNYLINAGTQAYFEIDFTAGTPAVGNSFHYTYLGIVHTVTYVTDAGAAAINEVQANDTTGASIADWLDQVFLPQIIKNPYLLKDFTVTRSGNKAVFTLNEVGLQPSFALGFTGSAVAGTVDLGTARETRDMRIVMDLYMEQNYLAGDYEFKIRKSAPPGTDGSTEFQIDELLRDLLGVDFPLFGELVMTECETMARKYHCFFSELYDNEYKAASQPAADLLYKTAVNSGVDYKRFQTLDFAGTFCTGAVKFLTNMPRITKVNTECPMWLYFYLPIVADIALKGTVYYTDGTSSDYDYWVGIGIAFDAGKIYRTTAGYNQLGIGYINPSKTVSKYTVFVYDHNTGNPVTETFTFKIDQLERYYNRYFLFQNSLGGVDTVWCHGLATKELSITTEEYNKPEPMEWADDGLPPLDGFLGQTPKQMQTSFEVNTGNKSADYYLYITQELLASNKIYEVGADRFIEVMGKVDKVALNEDDRNLNNLAFKGQYAFTERNSQTAV